jgi:hypothetical protein
MALLRKLIAKQKADAARAAEQATKRRAARIARKVARVSEESQNGLDDLPLEVAVAMEENPAQPGKPEPAAVGDDSVATLVARLEAIRERIWRLQAVFAVSLSQDVALEVDRFLVLFQSLAQQLKTKDASALDNLVRGHEALLLSPPVRTKPTVGLDTQRLCELRWEVNQTPMPRAPKRTAHHVPDGLGWML